MNGIENYVPTIREGIPPTEYWQSEEYIDLEGIEMILERSMGSQTKALKKPTYKELEKQPFLARITAKLEMNNHDGYCSLPPSLSSPDIIGKIDFLFVDVNQ